MYALTVIAALTWLAAPASRQPDPIDCAPWQTCRQQAIDAAERGDFETFHTVAWRAVQTGPRNDPELMYLLARAQSLSGRPDDALVMLRRLADRGIGRIEAETADDFRRVRELPEWPSTIETIRRAATAASSSAASPASPPGSAAASRAA